MANSLCKFSTFIVFICLALFLSDEQIMKGKGEQCGVPSARFGGSCFDDEACKNLCIGAEGANSGYCSDFMCLCIKNCQKHELCAKPSARFHGPCFDGDACKNLCKGGEAAEDGMCQDFMCLCLYNC